MMMKRSARCRYPAVSCSSVFSREPCSYGGKLADAGAPSVLAVAPAVVMLADAGAPAVLALAPDAVKMADAGAPAVIAPAPDAVMLSDAGAAARIP